MKQMIYTISLNINSEQHYEPNTSVHQENNIFSTSEKSFNVLDAMCVSLFRSLNLVTNNHCK